MRIAREMGITSGVTTNRSREELAKAGATYVCSLDESLGIIREILGD